MIGQNEYAKAGKELQKEKEYVRKVSKERDESTQFAMKMTQETGQKLLTALDAVVAIDPGMSLTTQTAKDTFANSGKFKIAAIKMQNEKAAAPARAPGPPAPADVPAGLPLLHHFLLPAHGGPGHGL